MLKVLDRWLPPLVLVPTAFYSFLIAFGVPSSGLVLERRDGSADVVVRWAAPCTPIQECAAEADRLQRGDVVLAVEGTPVERLAPSFLPAELPERAPIEVLVRRGDGERVIRWPTLMTGGWGRPRYLLLVMPLGFWILGTLSWTLARPRAAPAVLFSLLNYTFSSWFGAGVLSALQIAHSDVVVRALTWVLAALLLHLHASLLRRQGVRTWSTGWKALYVAVGALALLELFRILPARAYYLAFIAGVFGSAAISASRLSRRSSARERRLAVALLATTVIAMTPALFVLVVPGLRGDSSGGGLVLEVISYFGFLFLPSVHLYWILRDRLGGFELRANRLLSSYGFTMLYAAAFIAAWQAVVPAAVSTTAGVLLLLLFLVPAPQAHRSFERAFHRVVFGARYEPVELIRLFSSRIVGEGEPRAVVEILEREVCPSLLIRESALYLDRGETAELQYAAGVAAAGVADVSALPEPTARYRPQSDAPRGAWDWVRLAVPVSSGGERRGVWLFGRRDPDDFYGPPEIEVLSALAGYVAIGVQNQELLERAHSQARALRDANARLEERNAELERFAYTVSHDLKTPLTTIASFAGAVARDVAAGRTDRLAPDLRRIADAAALMGRLLDDLLALARGGRALHTPATVPMREVVETAREMVEAGASSQLELRCAPDLPAVRGDRTRLVEVFSNLLANALQFARDGGRVRVDVGTRDEDGETVFTVRDDGMGIDPSHRETVFRLFEKLDPQSEGTGIGLALVRRIVEAHGGWIRVDSDGVGHGSTFCFTLPLAGARRGGEDAPVPEGDP